MTVAERKARVEELAARAQRLPRVTLANSEAPLFEAFLQQRAAKPASEAEIALAEQTFGVAIPERYREHLLAVGDGGFGPGYGLCSLHEGLLGSKPALDYEEADAEMRAATLGFPVGHLRLATYESGWIALLVVTSPDLKDCVMAYNPADELAGPDELEGFTSLRFFEKGEARELHGSTTTREPYAWFFDEWYEDWLQAMERIVTSAELQAMVKA